MKFINYLTSIAGVDLFPMISLLIFFGFFTILIVYVVKTSKSTIAELARIPLDDEDETLSEK